MPLKARNHRLQFLVELSLRPRHYIAYAHFSAAVGHREIQRSITIEVSGNDQGRGISHRITRSSQQHGVRLYRC